MRALVIRQLGVRDIVMRQLRMIRAGRQFLPQFQRTYIRRILIPHPALVKRHDGNGQRKFAWFVGLFANRKGVLAHRTFGSESAKLNHDFIDHLALAALSATSTATAATSALATTFFARFARLRFGGVPSAASTTIMLVTNFF